MTKITQAFIFAAGRGERMRPITDTIPKPLIKIRNKSIIDYTIEKLEKISSIKKIIINGFYLSDILGNHIKNLNNPKIIFSKEIEKIETGGGLIFASKEINYDEPILLINGDVLWQDKLEKSDLELLTKYWKSNNCDILLGLKKKEEYLGYDGNSHGGGDFNFDQKTGNLTRFLTSEMSHVFIGIQIINPKILQKPFVKNLGKCFSMSEFYKAATNENGNVENIKGIELQGKYFHIGTPDAVKMTESSL